ncbi:sugar-binding domain-containing protein [Agarivorans sp. Alg241-V36]|uniref:sugar-binding domain-containing protein n=1 Tax=Agarivorans sp. Alg241-V36 TaxID=2305992 RepID=UPI0013D29855|nr:sugar-binding domain-containing protein [Agarivorans sp. Alg241-V36]
MSTSSKITKPSRQTIDFNANWQFQLQDPRHKSAGNEWRTISLPHDWSIEQPFSSQYEGATAYLPGGIGWYLKTFDLAELSENQRAFLLFDGIYNNATLWLNNKKLGEQRYGYSPFYFEITEQLKAHDNQLLIKVDRSRIADSRWYPGSGIYRDVKLITVNSLHTPIWSSVVDTIEINQGFAQILHKFSIVSPQASGNIQVDSHVIELDTGRPVASYQHLLELKQGLQKCEFSCDVLQPKLWSPESPQLYQITTTLSQGSKELDCFSTTFGLRDFQFTNQHGFFLNGQATKIKGVCLHHDGGLVGAAVPDAVWERRLKRLKQAGVNAIRMAHNPASESLLTLCDRLGFLVQDEFFDEWDFPKDKRLNMNEQHSDYASRGYAEFFRHNAKQDLKNALRAHINHPCIFMWSIGNEIEWTYPRNVEATGFFDANWNGNYFWNLPPNSPQQISNKLKSLPHHDYDIGQTAQQLAQWVREEDLSRPVTANCILPSVSYLSGYAKALDVIGFSYRQVLYDYGQQHHPQLPIISNEALPQWHEWKAVSERPHLAGLFLWTGIDYLGEVHKQWPNKTLSAGLLDTAGFKKAPYYLFQSLWCDKPMVQIHNQEFDEERFIYKPESLSLEERDSQAWKKKLWIWPEQQQHWNYKGNQLIAIEVISNCQEVELQLNGRSLGSKSLAEQADRIFRWALPFQTGELVALAKNKGKVVAQHRLSTTQAASDLLVTVEDPAPEKGQIAYQHLLIQLVDNEGKAVKHQNTQLNFELQGPAELVGLDNGYSTSIHAYKTKQINTYQGRALALIKCTGEAGNISLRVTTPEGYFKVQQWQL